MGDEVRCFWGRKVTGAAILFYLNKYMNILYLVLGLATFLTISDEVRSHIVIIDFSRLLTLKDVCRGGLNPAKLFNYDSSKLSMSSIAALPLRNRQQLYRT